MASVVPFAFILQPNNDDAVARVLGGEKSGASSKGASGGGDKKHRDRERDGSEKRSSSRRKEKDKEVRPGVVRDTGTGTFLKWF